MTVQQTEKIDFVVHDPDSDAVVLVMVEARDWGESGRLLPDLQKKLNTYLAYALEGQLESEHPDMVGKPIRFELRSSVPVGQREREFLDIVVSNHLAPEGIEFRAQVIGSH